MREFNNFEKDVISALVNAKQSYDLLGLFAAKPIMETTGECYAIEWSLEDGDKQVSFYCKEEQSPISITFNHIAIVSLLKCLEDNGLVVVSRKSHNSEPNRIYNHNKYSYESGVYWEKGVNESKYAMSGSKQTIHTDIAMLFDRYANAIILPTTELVMYVKNKFKTKEDIKFRNGQIATWSSIAIALFSSIWSVCQSTKPININEHQFNHIVSTIEEHAQHLVSDIVPVQVVNDTLNVNIKESVRINTRSHITNLPKP